MNARSDTTAWFVRQTPRRPVILSLGAVALGALAAVGPGQSAGARRQRRHNRRCKARCERKHPPDSMGLLGCQMGCALSNVA